jgi:predicted PurR-regulated permease PerM
MVRKTKKYDFFDRRSLIWGLTAFFVIVGSILFYMLFRHFGNLWAFIKLLTRILSPILWGFAIAYLICPMMKFFERKLFKPLGEKLFPQKEKNAWAFSRAMAIALAVVVMLILLAFLLWLVLPQLYLSIESIVLSAPDYVLDTIAWIQDMLKGMPELENATVTILDDLADTFISWVRTNLLPEMNSIITNVTTGVYYILREILNVAIGIVVSVYVLYNKEKFGANAKKMFYSVFSIHTTEKILRSIRFIDETFMGFIVGKLIDSLIIGVLCYILCLILGMPYAVLISVVIGVTNVIPVFGPFIGAVPTALIVLMDSPMKCLIFVLMIIILQQIDGNVIGPKILGNSLGVNGFWVMFAILVGAGLFGFMGMLLGVPFFTVLSTGSKALINSRLKKRGLSEETADYVNLDHIDPVTLEPVKRDPVLSESREEGTAG